MATYKQVIKELIRFKKTFDILAPKISRKLLGETGEFYVLHELTKRGYRSEDIEHKGGQSGYDIYLKSKDRRIEVKTSFLKEERIYSRDSTTRYYGWTIKKRNRRRKPCFDILIGIAMDDKFKKPKFYVFTYKEAFKVDDVRIGRFANVQKKIHLFENRKTYNLALNSNPKLVTRYERYVNKNRLQFFNKWSKI